MPVLNLFWTSPESEPLLIEPPQIQPPVCSVEPLPAIEDEEVLAFESGAGAVDIAGLQPAASLALKRFEGLIASSGGTITVTSAYRPPAYQEHLQQVWDKWMVEMRDNVEPGCAALKTDSAREFLHHGLLESQRPATYSEHTTGLAFDAAVLLPLRGRKRLRIDKLARRAGLDRPVAASDPVHFRVIGRRG
jgi:hypothetical protein